MNFGGCTHGIDTRNLRLNDLEGRGIPGRGGDDRRVLAVFRQGRRVGELVGEDERVRGCGGDDEPLRIR